MSNAIHPPHAAGPAIGDHLSEDQVQALCERGRVLEWKGRRPAVIAVPDAADGRAIIIKFWWPRSRRRLLGTGPRRRRDRFARACRQLAELGIPAPRILQSGSVGVGQGWWVCYAELPGETLRHLNERGASVAPAALAAFVRGLHESGVYFRALNLGNVVVESAAAPVAAWGLIDVADSRFLGRPLPLRMRARNLASLITHPREISAMFEGYGQEVVRSYAEAVGTEGRVLRRRVGSQVMRRTRARIRTYRRAGGRPLPIEHIPEAW